jgi:hypothetical protein
MGLVGLMLEIYRAFKTVLWSNILNLSDEHSQLFYYYCQLVSDPSMNPEQQTIEMNKIWEKAIKDKHLSDCLELVDYLTGAELSKCQADQRAYLAEYLEAKIEELIHQSGREDILMKQEQIAIIENNSYLMKRIEEPEPPQDLAHETIFGMALLKFKEKASEIIAEAVLTSNL